MSDKKLYDSIRGKWQTPAIEQAVNWCDRYLKERRMATWLAAKVADLWCSEMCSGECAERCHPEHWLKRAGEEA